MLIPAESRLTSGTKWPSRSAGECWLAIFRSESTALSRTTVSSTVARLSSGGWGGTDGYSEISHLASSALSYLAGCLNNGPIYIVNQTK